MITGSNPERPLNRPPGNGRHTGVRWVGYLMATLLISAVMVLLGNWQWDRYQDRRATNARVQASETAEPVPLNSLLSRPDTQGSAGPAPAETLQWTPVTVTGRYDSSREIIARNRTVNGRVGFEVLTPLMLADDTAVIVNRGWVQAPAGDALARPPIPAAPPGQVTVTGKLHFSESGPRPLQRYEGRVEVRRIALSQLASELPYPVYGAYVLMTEQAPATRDALVPIPVPTDNAWQSGAYAVQWWIFAATTIGWYIWAATRAARGPRHRPEEHSDPGAGMRHWEQP